MQTIWWRNKIFQVNQLVLKDSTLKWLKQKLELPLIRSENLCRVGHCCSGHMGYVEEDLQSMKQELFRWSQADRVPLLTLMFGRRIGDLYLCSVYTSITSNFVSSFNNSFHSLNKVFCKRTLLTLLYT